MKFWPFEKYGLKTARSPEETLNSLKEKTLENIFTMDPENYKKIFRGKIGEDFFKVTRMLRYRNAYKPVLKGTVEAHGIGSIVRVRMRMNAKAITSVVIIWIVGAVIAAALIPSVSAGESPQWSLLFLAPFVLFGYVLPMAAYSKEARRSRNALSEVIEGPSKEEIAAG